MHIFHNNNNNKCSDHYEKKLKFQKVWQKCWHCHGKMLMFFTHQALYLMLFLQYYPIPWQLKPVAFFNRRPVVYFATHYKSASWSSLFLDLTLHSKRAVEKGLGERQSNEMSFFGQCLSAAKYLRQSVYWAFTFKNTLKCIFSNKHPQLTFSLLLHSTHKQVCPLLAEIAAETGEAPFRPIYTY